MKLAYLKVTLVSIISIILLLIIEHFRAHHPEVILKNFDIELKIEGLLIIAVFISLAILIPTILNKLSPKLELLKIVIITGIVVFITEVGFKFVQYLLTQSFSINLKLTTAISIIGMLIANLRIRYLRKNVTLISWLFLISIWIIIGYLMSK